MFLKSLSRWLVLLVFLGTSFSVIAQDSQTIAIGETINGHLDSANVQALYHFSATEDDVLLISLTSSDFDTVLAVENAAGVQVESDDDGGQRTNSLISPFMVPATGEYTIVVAGYGSDTRGDYVLQLDRMTLETLNYGQISAQAVADDMPGSAYAIDAAAGDLLVAHLYAPDSNNLSMELLDPEGALTGGISYVDAETVRIGPVQIMAAGQYVLNVVAENDFEVMIDRIQPENLILGQSASVVLGANELEKYFAFSAETGQVLDFMVQNADGQALKFELLDPALFSIGRVDSSSNGLEINSVYVPIDGLYFVVVGRGERGSATEIAVDVTAEHAELPQLDEAPVELHFDSATSERILTFAGSEEELVRLIIEVDGMGDFGSPSVEILQAGRSLKYIELAGISRIAIDYQLPASGQVVLRFLSFADGVFEVTLDRSPEAED